MRLEHLFALFRPYRITDAEVKKLKTLLYAKTLETGLNLSQIHSFVASIETKSGVLLAHVSMMIAVTGLLFAVGGQSFIVEVVLACELIAYLFLALLCIRCQYQIDDADLGKFLLPKAALPPHHAFQKIVYGELLYRDWLFRKLHRALYVLTFLLAVTILVALFADDFGLNLEKLLQ